jgi:hypothetical protein
MMTDERQKKTTDEYRSNWDSIFKKSKPKRKMIDPPEGWKYGFPKEIPEHVDNTRQWLIDNGYPEKEIEACGDSFYVRGWYEESE